MSTLVQSERQTTTAHPLDPLTAEEIRRATHLFRTLTDAPASTRFALILLDEPTRAEQRAHAAGQEVDRRVRVVTVDRAGGRSLDATLSLTAGTLLRQSTVDPRTQGQPPVLVEEFDFVEQLVKADPTWRAAVERRGISDIDLVQVDPVSSGRFDHPQEEGLRLIRAVAYARDDEQDNAYAHPIDGLVAVVDLTNSRVLEVVDDEVLPVPRECANFHDDATRERRTGLKPLDVVQSEGPSFAVDGWKVDWQNWSFRLSMNPREGLVLHQVSYQDGDEGRPILNRAAVSEMVVPYGDPRPAHFWRSAFDAGEYGLGTLTPPLTLGCDCLGSIYYFDAVFADGMGEPQTVDNAICMHEEDYGVLWRHSDIRYGGSWVRRSRRLVVSFFSTVGNYDYGFFWYFYQDGSIQLEVKLTGVMQTAALPRGTNSKHIYRVGPDLGAQIHQHFFCARLDVEVDGPRNAVAEVNTVPTPMGPDNPYGNAFEAQIQVLPSEAAARRRCSTETARVWKIVNLDEPNALGFPGGYSLHPMAGARLLSAPESWVGRRAGFAAEHLWVTRYDPEQRYAAGDFPNQGMPDGLPVWTTEDRSVQQEEIVVWHSFGVTHVPRPEDWPIMPVEYAGFTLKPAGFFAENPALDLPKPEKHSSGGDHDACGCS
jgi:primary-amine oxidase